MTQYFSTWTAICHHLEHYYYNPGTDCCFSHPHCPQWDYNKSRSWNQQLCNFAQSDNTVNLYLLCVIHDWEKVRASLAMAQCEPWSGHTWIRCSLLSIISISITVRVSHHIIHWHTLLLGHSNDCSKCKLVTGSVPTTIYLVHHVTCIWSCSSLDSWHFVTYLLTVHLANNPRTTSTMQFLV